VTVNPPTCTRRTGLASATRPILRTISTSQRIPEGRGGFVAGNVLE
jgi:hypothetical protein